MKRQLFWRLCLVIATGVVTLFYFINLITSKTEAGMSFIKEVHSQQITRWGEHAEKLFLAGDQQAINDWLSKLRTEEDTWAAIVSFDIGHIAGAPLKDEFFDGYNIGRSVDWKVHLDFSYNPIMEVPFETKGFSFLIQLPKRMRPGAYWQEVEIGLQIIIPTFLLAVLAYLLYRHIMKPLRQLQLATQRFSAGSFDTRASSLMGQRNDEFGELALQFDVMAGRISDQLTSQRQLISDLSHELRTPLTRLDIATESLQYSPSKENIHRIERESKQIRKLVEDSLTLAWLENELPELQQENVELVDLLDVVVDDARFEFSDRIIETSMPDSALISLSSHRALGQAIENILRNALRYTPIGKSVSVDLKDNDTSYVIDITDSGPGVPESLLETIFKPFFRVEKSRHSDGQGFGLGLALAKRQIAAVRGQVFASNAKSGGLIMTVTLPKF